MMEALTAGENALWERFTQQAQLPQTLLVVSPEGRSCDALIHRIQARYLCDSPQGPCGNCRQCTSLDTYHEHPDLEQVVSETNTIKIEAIRALQTRIALGPQWANCRLIYLPILEQLTLAASNALLKTLEEPPQRIVFLAVTYRLDRLLPTILSRFERWTMPIEVEDACSYLALNRWRFQSEAFQSLMQQQALLWKDYCDWCAELISLPQLIAKWSTYKGGVFYQVFYCAVAERLRTGEIAMSTGFHLLDQSLKKIKTFHLHPSLNEQLALEDFFISIRGCLHLI